MPKIMAIHQGKKLYSQDFGYGDHYPCRRCRRSRPHYDYVSFIGGEFIDLDQNCGACTVRHQILEGLHDDVLLDVGDDTSLFVNRLEYLSTRARASAEAAFSRGRFMMGCNINAHFLFDRFKYQKYLCFYTGELLSLEDGILGMSIDRIDSSIGYIQGNVALSSWKANRAKSNLSLQEFTAMCRAVAQRHPA